MNFATINELKTNPTLHWIYDKAKQESRFTDSTVIFAVDDTIYCDSVLPVQLISHEATHLTQQQAMGYKKWWEKYFSDVEFKYTQELEAHINEYKALGSRQARRAGIKTIVDRMNSPLYRFTKKTTKEDIMV